MNESWVVFPASGNKYHTDVAHADAAMDLIKVEFPDDAPEIQRVSAAGHPSYPLDFALGKGAVRLFLCFGTAKRPDDQEAYVEFNVDPGRLWLVKTLRSLGVKRTWGIRVSCLYRSFDSLLFSEYCRIADKRAWPGKQD